MTLRVRLLLSYILLLAVTLAIITAALLLFLFAQPVPASSTYVELAALGRELISTGLLDVNTGRPLQTLAIVNERAQIFSEETGVRTLIVNLRGGTVLTDSANVFDSGAILPLSEETYTLPGYLQRGMPMLVEPIFGSFRQPDNSVWLFAGLVTARPGSDRASVLLAQPRPTQTWNSVLTRFRDSLALPLFQAALVGLGVAFFLAAFISQTIVRSLNSLGQAASAVAQGEFEQRVPVSGPPEIRTVAQAFNRMSEQVRETQQAQKDFLANVSHDLKTPLTSIQGFSQAIMDGAAKDPAQAAAIIHQEAGRLNRMVVELTDLARLQAGRLSMQSAAIDLGQLASAIGQRLSVVAAEKGVALHIQADPMPPIAGDGDRLAQVLTNLISNAIKYTPSGGQVGVRTQVRNGGVEVMVHDTGIGIPREDLPRIFERFYQVDKARGPRRGTGLGLAISQEIVHAHGGQITVTSAGRGQGSTFAMWLPSPQLSTVVRRR